MFKARCLLALTFIALPGFVQAAGQLSLSPASAHEEVNKPFTIKVIANAGASSVSAIEGDLSYDPALLEVDSLSIDASVLKTWATTPSYDSASGKIQFSGWAGQAVTGDGNEVLDITFMPLTAGEAQVQFTSGAMLDATDPSNNILTSMQDAGFAIDPIETPAPALPPEAPPQPPNPPILSPISQVHEGEIIAVKGTAQPNTTVQLFIQKDGEAPQESDVLSAADGSFAYVSSAGAETGVYYVWALAESAAGESSSTPRVELTVGSQAAALALAGAPDALLLLLPLVALVSLIAFGIAYAIHRRSRRHF